MIAKRDDPGIRQQGEIYRKLPDNPGAARTDSQVFLAAISALFGTLSIAAKRLVQLALGRNDSARLPDALPKGIRRVVHLVFRFPLSRGFHQGGVQWFRYNLGVCSSLELFN